MSSLIGALTGIQILEAELAKYPSEEERRRAVEKMQSDVFVTFGIRVLIAIVSLALAIGISLARGSFESNFTGSV